MKKSDLIQLTVHELKTLARKIKVSVSTSMKKADIVTALIAGMKEAKPAKKSAVAKKTAAPKNAVRNRTAAKAKIAAPKMSSDAKTKASKISAAKLPAATKRMVSREAAVVQKPQKSSDQPLREWTIPPRIEEPLLEQERIAESKYFTGQARKGSASAGDLPKSYHVDRIVLMARDPFVVHAYWEAIQERLEREKAWFGWDSKLCLRIYDITGVRFDGRNAVGYFDQEVFERIGNWYFDLGRPSHSFCADLGLIAPSGRFLTLARSNFVTTPRDGVSDVIDEEWLLVDDEFWKLYGYAEGFKGGVSSREMQEALKRRRSQIITSPGLSSPDRTKRK